MRKLPISYDLRFSTGWLLAGLADFLGIVVAGACNQRYLQLWSVAA
jgi:hypothetical protein